MEKSTFYLTTYASPTAVNASQVGLIFQNDANANPQGLYSMAIDNQGYLYVTQAQSILKLDPDGHVIATLGKDQFYFAKLVAVDNDGNIYVVDTSNDPLTTGLSRLTKMDAKGEIVLRKAFSSNSFEKIMADTKGNIYLVGYGWASVYQYDSTFTYASKAWSGELNGATMSGDDLYVSNVDYYDGIIWKSNGTGLTRFRNHFLYKILLAKDDAGNFYGQQAGD